MIDSLEMTEEGRRFEVMDEWIETHAAAPDEDDPLFIGANTGSAGISPVGSGSNRCAAFRKAISI